MLYPGARGIFLLACFKCGSNVNNEGYLGNLSIRAFFENLSIWFLVPQEIIFLILIGALQLKLQHLERTYEEE